MHVLHVDSDVDVNRKDYTQAMVALRAVPKLATCCLCSFYINVSDLKIFIERTSPRTLRLEHVPAQTDEWKSFFYFLACEQLSAEDLYLADL